MFTDRNQLWSWERAQLYLMYLKNWQHFFLCLKQDHGFGRGQGSPLRVLSRMPVARSAAEKDPGEEEGVLSQCWTISRWNCIFEHWPLSDLWFESPAELPVPLHTLQICKFVLLGLLSCQKGLFKISASQQQRGRWGGRRVTRTWTSPSSSGSSQVRCSKRSFTMAGLTNQPKTLSQPKNSKLDKTLAKKGKKSYSWGRLRNF